MGNNYMLDESLLEMTVDVLKSRLKLITNAKKVTRKAEIIDEISQYVLSEKIEDVWHKLGNLEQQAVAEALYHWHGDFHCDRFAAKYNILPEFFVSRYSPYKSAQDSAYLGLFFFNNSIPRDLQTLLKTFVEKPEANLIVTHADIPERYIGKYQKDPDEKGVAIKSLTMEALIRHDLPAVLNIVNQGKISVSEKTGVATSASMRTLETALSGGDYYQAEEQRNIDNYEGGPIRPIKAYAWPLLLQTSGLVKRNGKKLALTRKGIKALTAPFAETVKVIYERWRDKGKLDEYSRINLVKGQKAKGRIMTAPAPRRYEIEAILSECPAGEWISIDDLFRFIRAGDSDLNVCHDYFRLYLEEQGYGTLGYAENPFEVLEGRYLMAYLFEYLATLGMIDIAYVTPYFVRSDYIDLWGASEIVFFSRYDGLLYFRLNNLGEYCIGMNGHYQPVQIETPYLLEINQQLEITLIREIHADEQQILSLFCNMIDNNQWEFSEQLTLAALEQGQSTKDFYDFLEQRCEEKLPEAVDDFFAQLQHQSSAFSDAGMAQIIRSSSRLIKMITSDTTTRKLCLPVDNRTVIVPVNKEKEFRKALKKLGYLFPITKSNI